jgi:hypothetical protein
MEKFRATLVPRIRARVGYVECFASVITLGEAAHILEYVAEVDGWRSGTPPELRLLRWRTLHRVAQEGDVNHGGTHVLSAGRVRSSAPG